MKINLTKFSLTIFAALTLAACGSGGGNGSPSEPTQSAKPTSPITPEKPSEEKESLKDENNPSTGQVSGNRLNLSKGEAKEVMITTFVSNKEYPINQLVVEDKAVDIIPTGIQGNVVTIGGQTSSRVIGGTTYSNVRWGYLSEPALKESYVFAQGNYATEIMPSGSAKCVGNAAHLYTQNAQSPTLDAISLGNVNIDVNFDTKKLTGKIEAAPNNEFGVDKEVHIQADIKGNKFSGTFDGTSTEGGFYGKDASELTGYYSNSVKKYIGAFGAKKQ